MFRKYSLAAVAVCVALSASTAHARCSGFNKQVALFKTVAEAVCNVPGVGQYCDVAKQGAEAADLKKNAKNALKEWNDLANNGPSSIGPRRLQVGAKADHGKVVFPGKRLWVTNAVVNDTVKVTIKHTGTDKSRVVAELCAVDRNGGKPRWVKTLEFDKKTPKGKTRSHKVPLKNETLFVDIIPKTLGRSFTYSIAVK